MTDGETNAQSYAVRSKLVQTTVINQLLDKLDIQSGEAVLDLGCGTGAGTVLLSDRVGENGKVFGVDPDRERIKEAIKINMRKNIEYIAGTINEAKLKDEGIDKGLANAVVHWIPTQTKHEVFKELYRIMKPGASFLFTSSFSYNENVSIMLKYYPEDKRLHFENNYFMESEEFYRSLAKEIGFQISYFHSQYGEIPFPTVDDWLKWADASLYTDFTSTYMNCKDRIEFRKSEDGSIIDSGTFYICIFTK